MSHLLQKMQKLRQGNSAPEQRRYVLMKSLQFVILSLIIFQNMALGDNDINTLNIEEWRELSAKEKTEIAREWTPYTKNTSTILDQILQDFKNEYADINSMEVLGYGARHTDLVISVDTPFVFDKRILPDRFHGIQVYRNAQNVPPGFDIYRKYVWAPENWENYVDSNIDEIREKLGNKDMSKDEILAALIGMPFEEWILFCKEKGLTKKYAEKSWWKFW